MGLAPLDLLNFVKRATQKPSKMISKMVRPRAHNVAQPVPGLSSNTGGIPKRSSPFSPGRRGASPLSTAHHSNIPGRAEGQAFTAREAPGNPTINQMLAGAGPSKRSPAEIAKIKARAKASDPFTTGRTVDISHVGEPTAAELDKRAAAARKKTPAEKERLRKENERAQKLELRDERKRR